jgi:glutamate-ammonia-ligase adenylyltransferase
MYSLCFEKNFRNALVSICAQSGMLAREFALSPGLAETILTGVDAVLRDDRPGDLPEENVHEWKVREECKSAVRYSLGTIDECQLFHSLSEIASSTLSLVYERERKKLKIPKGVQFCIIGLGKLGGYEMNFGSDLDVVFLYQANRKLDGERCEKLAANIITECSRAASAGKLYDVDARLRPEGRNAPLAVAEKQYLEYLLQRASLWERQSLTRARVISGDKDFSAEILEMIQTSVYRSPLPKGWTEEILSMRRKTETRSRTSSSELLNIKLGPGGLMDVEFTVQALQLSRGKKAFPSTNTYKLLELYSHDTSGGEDIATIDKHYRLLRRVETALRVGLDMKTHLLPDDDESLNYLARLLKYPSSTELLSSLRSSMKETRTLFESILRSLK